MLCRLYTCYMKHIILNSQTGSSSAPRLSQAMSCCEKGQRWSEALQLFRMMSQAVSRHRGMVWRATVGQEKIQDELIKIYIYIGLAVLSRLNLIINIGFNNIE